MNYNRHNNYQEVKNSGDNISYISDTFHGSLSSLSSDSDGMVRDRYTCGIRVPGDYGYYNNYAGLITDWGENMSDNDQFIEKLIGEKLLKYTDVNGRQTIQPIDKIKKDLILKKEKRYNNTKSQTSSPSSAREIEDVRECSDFAGSEINFPLYAGSSVSNKQMINNNTEVENLKLSSSHDLIVGKLM